MTEPTGYTAVGMVGFTDKGTYSASASYVKNDLVHYGGSIWCCLIDDTTGITPTEGTNWTLFVGEATNMAERIIAPVEVSPSENAYSVGEQLIFNDTLYTVTTAIAIGDALTVGTNITESDKVTSQIQTLSNQVSTNTSNISANATAIAKLPPLEKTVSLNTGTSQTFTGQSGVTADMKVINSYIADDSKVTSDLEIVTAANSITVNGTVTGTTSLTLWLAEPRTT